MKNILKYERKAYRVVGGRVLVFGDLHLSATYEGKHKQYMFECYESMERVLEICKSENPSAVIFLGDLIGVNERNIRDRQFLMRVVMFFSQLNTMTKGNVFSVKGNHDIGDFSDFDFLLGLGYIKNPLYLDYEGVEVVDGKEVSSLEVRFHFVNYGDEHEKLNLTSLDNGVCASNIILGHSDFYIEGVTNWYSSRNGMDLAEFDNFIGADLLISGHIHTPSDEVLYTSMKDGSLLGLFYTGSLGRVAERYDDCFYVRFEYSSGGTGYGAYPVGLRRASEVFYPEESFIIEDEEKEEADMQSQRLTEYVKEIMESRLATGDLFAQIDKIPSADKETKELAKKYLRDAIEGN